MYQNSRDRIYLLLIKVLNVIGDSLGVKNVDVFPREKIYASTIGFLTTLVIGYVYVFDLRLINPIKDMRIIVRQRAAQYY